MERRQFDRFADEYAALHARNIAASGEGPEYFAEYKIRHMRALLDASAEPADGARILDFGAGVGNSVPWFNKYFPQSRLVCADVSERSLGVARRRSPGAAHYVLFEGGGLPFDAASFDLAFTACVFHHIAAGEHIGLLREIRRVLSPRGQLFLYEHNPFNPLTVRAVRTCEFDEDAVLIPSSTMRKRFEQAGFAEVSVRYCVFFPHFLRKMRFLEQYLAPVPAGAQYCVVGKAANLLPQG